LITFLIPTVLSGVAFLINDDGTVRKTGYGSLEQDVQGLIAQ